jgi:hypothetical protein
VDEVRDHFELPSDERRERALAVELQTWWAASTGGSAAEDALDERATSETEEKSSRSV